MSNIQIDRPADHVYRIRINRPAKLNAIDFAVRDEMISALESALADPTVRALVLGGVGDNLSAGGDLPSMQGLDEAGAQARLAHIHRLCGLIAGAKVPVITAIEGVAAGASVGMALLGDYIIGAKEARVIVPFLMLGLVQDWGMIYSLPRRVGLTAARRIMVENAIVQADEAHRLGLFDELVAKGEAGNRAVARASELARLPLHAFALLKARLADPADSLAADFECERRDQVACLTHTEFHEGLAAFMEKRSADFSRL